LTDALLARIEALDPQLNAFLLPTPEKAREQAKAAEREIMAGSYRGPLHGMPFGLKDIYATRRDPHDEPLENLREPRPDGGRHNRIEALPGWRGAAGQARDA
jgi:amidase